MIDKKYVLSTKKIYRAEEQEKYKYCTTFAGDSDIASLAYRTSHYGEIGEIPFCENGECKVYLIAGDTKIPANYKQVVDTHAG